MLNRKRPLAFAGCALLLMAAWSSWGVGQAHAKTTWDYYLFTGITHPVSVYLKGFADDVTKRTNGELTIITRPAGELPYRATEVLKAVGDGLVQGGSAYAGFISGSAPLSAVTGQPFLVRTYEDLEKAWPVMQGDVDREFARLGVKRLFYWSWPPQNFWGNGEPIRNVEGFSGRKLRTTDPKQAEMLRRLNASSVTLTTAEVPVAMERGVMAGVSTAAFNIIGAKWYEFLKWGRMDEIHIGGPNYEVVNIEAYNALPANIRKILDDTAAEWQRKMLREIAAAEGQARARLRDEFGIRLIIPDQDQAKRLTALMAPYWEEWAATQGDEGRALMRHVRQALGK